MNLYYHQLGKAKYKSPRHLKHLYSRTLPNPFTAFAELLEQHHPEKPRRLDVGSSGGHWKRGSESHIYHIATTFADSANPSTQLEMKDRHTL